MSKALFILSELIDRDIDWIITSGNREYISAGTVLIHENEPIAALYILLEGTLSISVAALGDREINRVTQGEILGEMSFIDGRLPSATVTALEDCFILAIPRSQLTEKMDQDVLFSLRFYRAITKFLSSRLRNTNTITPDAQTMPSGQDTSSPLIDPEAT
ncbi:MAG: cyclic nucleotide-binding domain-containing protein, partial [Oscillatoriales cyanobacterium RM1_1_9]|nr:cyclic nucleotide-binding domain-containing protein [Oscillatoriales cyanobacterium RM1_1_9]